jgi:hypothetical protein
MNLTFKHYVDVFEKYLISAKNLPVRSPDQQKTALNANRGLELCRTFYTAALDQRISVCRQYRKIFPGCYQANQLRSMKAKITELDKAEEAGRTVTIVPPMLRVRYAQVAVKKCKKISCTDSQLSLLRTCYKRDVTASLNVLRAG